MHYSITANATEEEISQDNALQHYSQCHRGGNIIRQCITALQPVPQRRKYHKTMHYSITANATEEEISLDNALQHYSQRHRGGNIIRQCITALQPVPQRRKYHKTMHYSITANATEEEISQDNALQHYSQCHRGGNITRQCITALQPMPQRRKYHKTMHYSITASATEEEISQDNALQHYSQCHRGGNIIRQCITALQPMPQRRKYHKTMHYSITA